jgi:hemin uptake protein HemP
MNTKTKPDLAIKPASRLALKPAVPPTVDSQQLFGNGRECWITHAGQTYRLCHTRNDKLILIK